MNFSALIYVCCIVLSKTLNALLVFVMDEAGRVFPVDLLQDATVRKLKDEIVRFIQLDTEDHEIAISFQRVVLTDHDLDTLLADTGLSNECTVQVRVVRLIRLRRVQALTLNAPKVLKWDMSKDISQFAWLQHLETNEVGIGCFAQNGQAKKIAVYQQSVWYGVRTVQSHSFFMVASDQFDAGEQHSVECPQEAHVVCLRDLQQARCAKDILVRPADGDTMRLYFTMYPPAIMRYYQFPDGYSLLLRHKNGSA